jgi:hypothetical protein
LNNIAGFSGRVVSANIGCLALLTSVHDIKARLNAGMITKRIRISFFKKVIGTEFFAQNT